MEFQWLRKYREMFSFCLIELNKCSSKFISPFSLSSSRTSHTQLTKLNNAKKLFFFFLNFVIQCGRRILYHKVHLHFRCFYSCIFSATKRRGKSRQKGEKVLLELWLYRKRASRLSPERLWRWRSRSSEPLIKDSAGAGQWRTRKNSRVWLFLAVWL